MPLNLITDAWLPVRGKDGSRRNIAPWEMADDTIIAPDWPRPDLNIACYEFLIGLVYLADPPAHGGEWSDRKAPDPTRLRSKLAPYAPAFNLLGDGPLFMQDLEAFGGEGNGTDMLFIDSAGENAAKKNADVMVHRGRYGPLDLPFAAMAIYTFQTFAPPGGAGNRTSMRGGGPLVTLVDPNTKPDGAMWNVIWANVPYGRPSEARELPWMRATVLSDKGQQTLPPAGKTFGVEAFFGMPRRLRLRADAGTVIDVVQKPSGTNYALWKHPLSPYYRQKVGSEWLPKHPRAGRFGYRSWLGIVAQQAGDDALSELALCLRVGSERLSDFNVIVAGWAMENMKPRDFTLSAAPYLKLSDEGSLWLENLINGASAAATALRGSLEHVLHDGEAREAQREVFFLETETRFLDHVQTIKAGKNPCAAWLADLRAQALGQFDALALPLIEQQDSAKIKKLVDARKFLGLAFAGYGKQGRAIFEALDQQPPEKKGKAA
jgi:CRISPR system Cascade subunit CasA